MACLLIVAHDPLASAFAALVAHVRADRLERVAALDVRPEWSADEAQAQARLRLDDLQARHGSGVLVLADVFGATPANAAQRLVQDRPDARLVAGLNVPMLWRALCYLDEPLEALAARALNGGTQGVMPVRAQPQQNQPLHSLCHDSPDAHHQQ